MAKIRAKIEVEKEFNVPDEYEPLYVAGKIQFRQADPGETYLGYHGSVITDCQSPSVGPRLIVRKKWSWPKELGPDIAKVELINGVWFATTRGGPYPVHIELNTRRFPWWVSPPIEDTIIHNNHNPRTA